MNRSTGREPEIFGMEREDIFRKRNHQERVKARSLFCYWMVRQLEASLTDLAKRLELSVAGIGVKDLHAKIIIGYLAKILKNLRASRLSYAGSSFKASS